MRPLLALAFLASCKPSATVDRTMPVANLQPYRTVGLRVHTAAFASQGHAMFLEGAVTQKLREKCSFDAVGPVGQGKPDIILDLNITKLGRGGGGVFTNPNLATVDTLVVLTDGQDGELLGTATIHGKSSGMLINNNVPEQQAIDVVAQTIVELLAKSGCHGPRVAKEVPPPPPPIDPNVAPGDPGVGSGGEVVPPPVIDEGKRAQAEQLNEQGKEKLYGADLAGALALFQQANATAPDPKYVFNTCLTLGAQEQWDSAIAACRQARTMNPNAALATKIDRRIELLQNRQ